MPELPCVTGRDAVRALQRRGFVVSRINGSHHIMRHPDRDENVSVPVHGNKTLKRGTLRGLIRQSGLTVEEFVESL